ncbi:hypothetical protein COCCADRAFT_112018, partial [Bipolaris zeicola 26-R-13]
IVVSVLYSHYWTATVLRFHKRAHLQSRTHVEFSSRKTETEMDTPFSGLLQFGEFFTHMEMQFLVGREFQFIISWSYNSWERMLVEH